LGVKNGDMENGPLAVEVVQNGGIRKMNTLRYANLDAVLFQPAEGPFECCFTRVGPAPGTCGGMLIRLLPMVEKHGPKPEKTGNPNEKIGSPYWAHQKQAHPVWQDGTLISPTSCESKIEDWGCRGWMVQL